MKFYDRANEVAILKRIQADSGQASRFTVITGRRRIGKTELIKRSFTGTPFLYFFMARRSESELCENFAGEIEEKLGIPVPGRFSRVSDILTYVFKLAKTIPITLVLDEFQELVRIDSGVFSTLQRDWDMMKGDMRLNLIVSGSINRLMNKIFRDRHEPLYGRQTDFLKLRPFSTAVLREILVDGKSSASPEDVLALYAFTGGVAKYVEMLVDGGALDRDAMIDFIFREESTFLEEGISCLSDEFGKNYGTYFSILSAVAGGGTSRSDIESAVGGAEVGGYLDNLIREYGLLARRQPLFARPGSKNLRYAIDDNFFLFWFRFVARYSYMLEIGAHGKLRDLVRRDYNTFSGLMLERYFRQKLAEEGSFTRIGGWWNRKGEDEIDIIAEDELEKRALFAEVKRDPARISLGELRRKAESFRKATGRFKGYDIVFQGLSLGDM